MKAEVVKGYLEYSDARGSYRVPVGRKGRKCLAILDQREGEYIRSLELDLFTGFVYYCVDNATSGGLSYYYDMSSKKVGHYFIHRYLRNARNHGFTASPEEMEIFEKLPCDNWVEEIEKLPGWKEAIDGRLTNLLLPGKEPVRISMGHDSAGSAEETQLQEGSDSPREITSISFLLSPASRSAATRERVFTFERAEGTCSRILRCRNDAFGEEFFGETGEYDYFLTEKEYRWIFRLAETLSDGEDAGPKAGDRYYDVETADRLSELRFDQEKEDLVLQEYVLRYADGDKLKIQILTPAQEKQISCLRTVLYGLLRREVVLC